MGDLNHGTSAFIDWNLLLDEHGGPNYAGNFALAPFFYDTRKKTLQPHLLSQYYEHFAQAVIPGSARIASSRYTHEIEATAWKRPDGTLAIVMLNPSKGMQPVCVRLNNEEADIILYPRSITSAVIHDERGR